MIAERIYSLAEIDAMRPQAAAELRQFAKVLEARGVGLTAAQLRMAIQMAEAYQEMRAQVAVMTPIMERD